MTVDAKDSAHAPQEPLAKHRNDHPALFTVDSLPEVVLARREIIGDSELNLQIVSRDGYSVDHAINLSGEMPTLTGLIVRGNNAAIIDLGSQSKADDMVLYADTQTDYDRLPDVLKEPTSASVEQELERALRIYRYTSADVHARNIITPPIIGDLGLFVFLHESEHIRDTEQLERDMALLRNPPEGQDAFEIAEYKEVAFREVRANQGGFERFSEVARSLGLPPERLERINHWINFQLLYYQLAMEKYMGRNYPDSQLSINFLEGRQMDRSLYEGLVRRKLKMD